MLRWVKNAFSRAAVEKIDDVDAAYEAMCNAINDLNDAWHNLSAHDKSYRPWVDWENRRVIMIKYNGGLNQVFPTTD